MRVLLCLSAVCFLGVAHCSIVSSPVVTYTPSAITTSQRIGGSFAYATLESRAVPSVVHRPLTSAPLVVAQPLQSIFGHPFFNPVISSPFYPGIAGQTPIIGQTPIFGQNPVFGGPVQTPVAPPPQGVPQGPAPPPPGAVVDDDTVSVESA